MPPKKQPPSTRFNLQPPSARSESYNSTHESGKFDKLLKITGYPAVAALFHTAPERIVRFFYEERMIPKVGAFCTYMAGQHRPYRMLDTAELSRVAGTVRHGGIVAIAEPQSLSELSVEEAKAWTATSRLPLFALDGIGNTHNVGAIARTLAFFGYNRLILSNHPAQAGLSDSAYRVAEGGLEYLEIYQAPHLPTLLHKLQSHYRIAGTALDQGIPLEKLPDDPRPTLIIMGNEEQGLAPATLKACEVVIKIRGKGAVQSLNVSATAAILAYALKSKPVPLPASTRPARPGSTGNPSKPRRPRPKSQR